MTINISHSEPIFPIRTAAKLLDISIPTLRMYEKEGLIIPAKTEGNQRVYSQNDIERLKCIRHAIKEQKYSISAIKSMYSMIPCWEIVGCSESERENCDSYKGHSEPCWSGKHEGSVCSERVCRDCEVYNNYFNCGDIKELIKNMSRKN